MQSPWVRWSWLIGALFVCQGATVAMPATVFSIGDGDTIRVRQAGRAVTVRLACIDAPEMAQSPYEQQARSCLQQRLPVGREVTLEVKTTDRYGSSVAEVMGGVNINLAMVENGQAFAYRQYLRGCDAKAYLDAEQRASRRRIGVWQVPGGSCGPGSFGGSAGAEPRCMPCRGIQPQVRHPATRLAAASAAGRSALLPWRSSCSARGTGIWIAMAMGWPVNACVDPEPNSCRALALDWTPWAQRLGLRAC
jgi:endonuclease YncB( thermonuclease family)